MVVDLAPKIDDEKKVAGSHGAHKSWWKLIRFIHFSQKNVQSMRHVVTYELKAEKFVVHGNKSVGININADILGRFNENLQCFTQLLYKYSIVYAKQTNAGCETAQKNWKELSRLRQWMFVFVLLQLAGWFLCCTALFPIARCRCLPVPCGELFWWMWNMCKSSDFFLLSFSLFLS